MKVNVHGINLIMSIAQAVDLMNPQIANHHMKAACIAYHLASEAGLTENDKKNVTYAAALHDIGGITLKERLNSLSFDFEDSNFHAEKGWLLLKTFKPFSHIADIVRYHHTRWNWGSCRGAEGQSIPYESHLLNLADRISVLIDAGQPLLSQADNIRKRIEEASGEVFMPELTEVFISLSKKEFFWLDAVSVSLHTFLERKFTGDRYELEGENFLGLIKMFSRIIDFRSRFTSAHSSGVAAVAEALSKLKGFSDRDARLMKIAGYIHDLGKLAIPPEILEKPDRLTPEEYAVIRTHSYYTDLILRPMKELDTIREWGAYHHERMDGKGYPFCLDAGKLTMGSRIIAVCDVFVALTEDRPYRRGMEKEEVKSTICRMADEMALDPDVVSLLIRNYDYINQIRDAAQKTAAKEYGEFLSDSEIK